MSTPDPVIACAYCGTRHPMSDFPVRWYAECADCHEKRNRDATHRMLDELKTVEDMLAQRDRQHRLDVAQRDALREAIGTDADAEAYISNLRWGPDATDRERTLVAGNIRAFHAWIKTRAGEDGE